MELGALRIRPPGGCKDVNDLHRRDPDGFATAFRAMVEAAEPLAAAQPQPEGGPLDVSAHAAGALIGQVRAQIAANRARGRLGIPTGFAFLQRAIEGYQPGHLWTVAGYTSKGKTSFALQAIVNVLDLEPGAVVALFSLEMTNTWNLARVAACRCGIPAVAILKGNWTPADRPRIEGAFEWLAGRPLYAFDRLTTLPAIRAAAEALKASVGLSLAVVDFVQNIRGQGSSIYERMSTLAPELQDMAKELGCTVVALSQVSNEAAKNDLDIIGVKGGGELPAASDLVLWLEREPDSQALTVAIRKNRHGRTGKRVLYFDRLFTRLTEGNSGGGSTCNGAGSNSGAAV